MSRGYFENKLHRTYKVAKAENVKHLVLQLLQLMLTPWVNVVLATDYLTVSFMVYSSSSL